MITIKNIYSISLSLLLVPGSVHGVVVAGANGAGTSANTTQAQLESAIGGTFDYYDNVIQYSTATGVYLGYDSVTKDVWVLSAKHVTNSSASVNIQGTSYAFQSRTNLSVDLELIRYSNGSGLTPTLPTIAIATSTPTAGTDVIMIGAGRTRTEAATTDPSTSDASATGGGTSGYNWDSTKIVRWGTNETSLSPTVTGLWTGGSDTELHPTFGEMFFTTFDSPGSGEWMTSNEAGLANGDSGGGVFVEEGGEWKLAGINSILLTLNDQDANTTAFGNQGGHINLEEYADDIQAVTGTLVPEPSSVVSLFSLGALLLFKRRR